MTTAGGGEIAVASIPAAGHLFCSRDFNDNFCSEDGLPGLSDCVREIVVR